VRHGHCQRVFESLVCLNFQTDKCLFLFFGWIVLCCQLAPSNQGCACLLPHGAGVPARVAKQVLRYPPSFGDQLRFEAHAERKAGALMSLLHVGETRKATLNPDLSQLRAHCSFVNNFSTLTSGAHALLQGMRS
jgi:hypothetical protein